MFDTQDPDFDGPTSPKWRVLLPGPQKSPYEGGVFELEVRFPPDYPFKPPRIRFVTPVWGPDIDPRTGAIDLDILGSKFSPALSVLKARGPAERCRC